MRLGYDASPIRGARSGIGHYAASLLDALQASCPQNEYLVFSHLGDPGMEGSSLIMTQKWPFPVKELWMQFWLPRLIHCYRPHLCHFTNSIAPLHLQARYVITVHDLSLVHHPEWHPRTRRIWMRNFMRPSILGASGVICVSEATRKVVLSWLPLDPSTVWTVPLAARPVFAGRCSEAKKAAARAMYGLERPFILYVGNIEPRKNLTVLLETYRRLRPQGIELVFVGRQGWLAEEFLHELRKPCQEGTIRLLGYLPEESLAALYQAALAFVYPTIMEGFGLPVLEAMASGTPVLTSRIEPLASMVGEAGWLADPRNVDEWVAALEEILRDKDKRLALAACGKERASRYSWPQTALATLRCYEATTHG